MLDPIPPPPPLLFSLTQPIAKAISLPTLPYHVHEVLGALLLYQSVQSIISPIISKILFPSIYNNLNRRTRINWDVHVVSFVQSCLINVLALYVMFNDQERSEMKNSVVERVFGYTGASGLIQGLACGYFIWDLIVSTRYIKIFGIGIWAHAITALCVFSFGFVSGAQSSGVREDKNANTITETFCELLRTFIYSLRTVEPILEHPLVL